LIRRAAGQLRHMVEFEDKGADAGGRRTDFDDQVADLRLRHLGAHGIPTVPAVARVKTENLPAPAGQNSVHFRSGLRRTDDLHMVDGFKQYWLTLRQPFRDAYASGGAESLIR